MGKVEMVESGCADDEGDNSRRSCSGPGTNQTGYGSTPSDIVAGHRHIVNQLSEELTLINQRLNDI